MELEEISISLNKEFLPEELWENKENHAYIRVLIAIVERALNDLQFLYNPQATKKQKEVGRNAFVWLFVERTANLEKIYKDINSSKHTSIYATSFDRICSILGIHPEYFREKIKDYLGFFPADLFK